VYHIVGLSVILKDKNDDGSAQNNSEKKPLLYFLIAICFAEFNLEPGNTNHLAKWLSFDEIMSMNADNMITPGLIQKVERTELIYSKGVLL
jgi:hypothetical protein